MVVVLTIIYVTYHTEISNSNLVSRTLFLLFSVQNTLVSDTLNTLTKCKLAAVQLPFSENAHNEVTCLNPTLCYLLWT